MVNDNRYHVLFDSAEPVASQSPFGIPGYPYISDSADSMAEAEGIIGGLLKINGVIRAGIYHSGDTFKDYSSPAQKVAEILKKDIQDFQLEYSKAAKDNNARRCNELSEMIEQNKKLISAIESKAEFTNSQNQHYKGIRARHQI